MQPIEIITIIVAIVIVGSVFGTYIYKKIKHLPTGECSVCNNKGKNLQKMYNKKYNKKS